MTKLYAYLSLGMSIFFMMASVLVAVSPPDDIVDPPYFRYVVAFILFGYGLFRLTRAIRAMKHEGDRPSPPPPPGDSKSEEEAG